MYEHGCQLSVYIQIQLDTYNTAKSWFSLHETASHVRFDSRYRNTYFNIR